MTLRNPVIVMLSVVLSVCTTMIGCAGGNSSPEMRGIELTYWPAPNQQ